jgi:uncharacterized protein (DUF1697 family)
VIVARYVAFLRAVNVAGHASVRMSDVRDLFVAAGGRRVRTYIQSGNVVFDWPGRGTAALEKSVRARLRRLLGEEPEILVRAIREVEQIVASAPFEAFDGQGGLKLYVVFLAASPQAPPLPLASAREALEVVAIRGREVFLVSRRKKNGFYGFPNDFVEQALGVRATSRNWSTVTKLVQFARVQPDDA